MFDSYEACQARCGDVRAINACGLGPDAQKSPAPNETGPCEAFLTGYTIDNTGTCVEISMSGCSLDARLFETVEACETTCGAPGPMGPGTENQCGGYKPVELAEGEFTCAAVFTGYQVDELGTCTEYGHSGCERDPRLFENKEACQAACETPLSVPTDPTGAGTPE